MGKIVIKKLYKKKKKKKKTTTTLDWAKLMPTYKRVIS